MFGMSDPFSSSEKKMHHEMTEAKGDTTAETWIKKMIAHHQGAIDMSRVLLESSDHGPTRAMAEETIEKQEKEINKLADMLVRHQSEFQS